MNNYLICLFFSDLSLKKGCLIFYKLLKKPKNMYILLIFKDICIDLLPLQSNKEKLNFNLLNHKMINFKQILLLISAFLASTFAFSQQNSFNKSTCEQNVYYTIKVLSHDSLNGREAGTIYEQKAADFIENQFRAMGLQPYFKNFTTFQQEFTFKDGQDYSEGTFLKINNKSLILTKDFRPLEKSTNATVSGQSVRLGFGMEADSLGINDYKNALNIKDKIFILEISVPGGSANYQKYSDIANIDAKIKLATKKGAKAIIFVNSDPSFTDPRFFISNEVLNTDVPVIFASNKAQKLLLAKDDLKIDLSVNIKKISKTGYNIAAFIDNKAEKTILIGGHYDHLGMGNFSSRYTGKPAIHNGADDNASGVAAMLELAKYYKANPAKFNFIFVAFSAEEKGLLGSAFMAKEEKDKLKNVFCMLNFDMVGRLDSITKTLNLIGTGTANEWDTLILQTETNGLRISKSASGIGGSDQTSFYVNQIPVLFFFTGIHADYHTPADDIEKINIKGEVEIVAYSIRLIDNLSKINKLTFHKTKEETTSSRVKGGVTLGIVPAFGGEEEGMAIQAVQGGKVAEKAGLLKDDVIIKIGNYEVKNIQDYMKALSHFTFGQKTQITVKRGAEIITKDVEF